MKLIFTVALTLILAAPAFAGECWLKNRGSFAADVRIYDGRGNLLRSRNLAPNQREHIVLQGSTRIEYEYKYKNEDNYHSKTGARCDDNREIPL